MARDLATGDTMQAAIAAARDEIGGGANDLSARALDQAEAEIDVLARIPAALIAETAELKTMRAAGLGRGAGEERFRRLRADPRAHVRHPA